MALARASFLREFCNVSLALTKHTIAQEVTGDDKDCFCTVGSKSSRRQLLASGTEAPTTTLLAIIPHSANTNKNTKKNMPVVLMLTDNNQDFSLMSAARVTKLEM